MASKPLQEPAFLILSALAAGPLHGYGIAQDVAASSDGRVTLRAGTLYGAIDRLVAADLVEIDHEEVVDSRLRRCYRLTAAGGERLDAEARRAEAQAQRALDRLDARRRAAGHAGRPAARSGALDMPGVADGGVVPA